MNDNIKLKELFSLINCICFPDGGHFWLLHSFSIVWLHKLCYGEILGCFFLILSVKSSQ